MRVLKFLVAGATGVSVNLGIFHVLYVAGIPYLGGSAIAVLLSMTVGFLLQKYWTFEDRTPERMPVQFFQYAMLALGNVAFNTAVIYILIGKLGVFYLFAQAIAAAIVATYSFFVYRLFIFRSRVDSGKVAGL
ncbi:TPA: hypothetical protein DIV48_01140 [Candidatus Kaiserbacteria bacterium]|nr:MAG: GtrA-like protein [Parcubacteria group bacterium GW2011_GWA1_56_13]KKW46309.1 MAG: GtrA-like protein [Parcubacteria group bacterium GW2011_GWB1_57_6]HCR52236.1 hypothetical protein [Candidatus Kaiserbacteria bacterium]